jgi:hypothetical protein
MQAQSGSSLPLHRLDLTAVLQKGIVSLTWSTENEANTSRFLIQRSNDGFNYTTIGTQPAGGQTNFLTVYQSEDNILSLSQANIIYYRIRAEDNVDNRFAYSNIVPVKVDINTDIKVWPNPFLSEIRITYPTKISTTVDAIIHDFSGRIVSQRSFTMLRGLNQVPFEAAKLAAGIYTIQLNDRETGIRFTQRLIKQ